MVLLQWVVFDKPVQRQKQEKSKRGKGVRSWVLETESELRTGKNRPASNQALDDPLKCRVISSTYGFHTNNFESKVCRFFFLVASY
jgi:hypothetical protein